MFSVNMLRALDKSQSLLSPSTQVESFEICKLLVDAGSDITLQNSAGLLPGDLTADPVIRKLLGKLDSDEVATSENDVDPGTPV